MMNICQQIVLQRIYEKFKGIDRLNEELGLDYWSNRINSWEDFPSVVATINGSLGAEFDRFQRQLVNEFLAWQVSIVNEYKRKYQFVTQNFDFDWRGYSYGVQSSVDHYAAAKPFDIVGVDIYHPSQDNLTGIEISFGGDMARSLKQKNYYVIETQAQAFSHWTPYPSQLRLQAFSHLASGAEMVAYWYWHSIHNSFETYWKGLLSHDFLPNPVYNEAKTIGADFARLSNQLIGLSKRNKVAILVSNEALSAMEWFKLPDGRNYNDIVRWLYDECYRLNIECDFIFPTSGNMQQYKLIIVPALYAAPDELLNTLNHFVELGGHVVYSFKSGFTNDQVKVRTTIQPAIIEQACGVNYHMFVSPKMVGLRGTINGELGSVEGWMELLTPTTAEVLAYFDHPQWGDYAAITRNEYGKGEATYIGCMTQGAVVHQVLKDTLERAGLYGTSQQLPSEVTAKTSINAVGREVRFYMNYSANKVQYTYFYASGKELLSDAAIELNSIQTLEPWGVHIVEVQ